MPALMISSEFIIAFHIIETLECSLFGWLIQSIRFEGEIYFEQATLFHRLFVVISCHPSFIARAVEKSSNFFMPHPPHFLGRFRASHFTHASILPEGCPF